MAKEQYWNRKCKTKGCQGLARARSDYCRRCIKIWGVDNLTGEKIKDEN